MSLDERASELVEDARRAEEEWLTVKQFSARVNMSESAVREAIRERRLAFRVERLTTGRKPAIRIVMPRHAA